MTVPQVVFQDRVRRRFCGQSPAFRGAAGAGTTLEYPQLSQVTWRTAGETDWPMIRVRGLAHLTHDRSTFTSLVCMGPPGFGTLRPRFVPGVAQMLTQSNGTIAKMGEVGDTKMCATSGQRRTKGSVI